MRTRTAVAQADRELETRGAGRFRVPVPQPEMMPPRPVAGSRPPGHVRVIGLELHEADRAYITRKLRMRLGKFADVIERATVRLTDENGPKGGVDILCRVKVVLSGHPSIVVESRSTGLRTAVDSALRTAGEAVHRRLDRGRP